MEPSRLDGITVTYDAKYPGALVFKCLDEIGDQSMLVMDNEDGYINVYIEGPGVTFRMTSTNECQLAPDIKSIVEKCVNIFTAIIEFEPCYPKTD